MNQSHSESGQASMILLVLSSIFVTIKLIILLSNCPIMINKIGTGGSKKSSQPSVSRDINKKKL